MDTAVLENTYEIERNKPMPSKNHAKIQTRLILALAKQINPDAILSEPTLELNDWICNPDIALFEPEPLDVMQEEIRVQKPPKCAIEIISPTQTLNELTDKAIDYLEHGVKSCWLVLPTLKTIYVFSGPRQFDAFIQDETVKDEVLGIELSLGSIFS